jgi:hypothetical protein
MCSLAVMCDMYVQCIFLKCINERGEYILERVHIAIDKNISVRTSTYTLHCYNLLHLNKNTAVSLIIQFYYKYIHNAQHTEHYALSLLNKNRK